MRLTGLPDLTARPLRPSTASSARELASPTAIASAKRSLAEGVVNAPRALGARPPVDSERVAEIRKAIKDGSYPLIPAQIADAMIAAKLYGIVGG